jgi:hypothetical protein
LRRHTVGCLVSHRLSQPLAVYLCLSPRRCLVVVGMERCNNIARPSKKKESVRGYVDGYRVR